jgi:hypothetical protein
MSRPQRGRLLGPPHWDFAASESAQRSCCVLCTLLPHSSTPRSSADLERALPRQSAKRTTTHDAYLPQPARSPKGEHG